MWMTKLVGEPTLVLPEGVPAEWASRAEALLLPLDKAEAGKGRQGLARDILAFVLHGAPLAILKEVAQRQEVGEHLRLLKHHPVLGAQDAPNVYEHFSVLPVQVALRWARFLEAAAGSHKAQCRMSFPRGIVWPEVLLLHCAGYTLQGAPLRQAAKQVLPAACMEALLVEDGLDPAALLVAAFATPASAEYGLEWRFQLVTGLVGYPQALERHVDAIQGHLLPADVPQRLHALAMIAQAEPATLDRLAPQLCELGTSGSKQVRATAETLLRRCGAGMFESLRKLCVEGKPEQRVLALRLMAALAAARDLQAWVRFARDTAAADKAPSVRTLADEWVAAEQAAAAGGAGLAYALPVIDWSGATNLPAPELLECFWNDLNTTLAEANASAREWRARMLAQGNGFNWRATEHALFTDDDMRALHAYLAADAREPPQRKNERSTHSQYLPGAVDKLIASGPVTPVAILKLLLFFGMVSGERGELLHPVLPAFEALHRRTGRPKLLELSAMLDQAGCSGKTLLLSYCNAWGAGFASEWPPEDVWPYFAHHVDGLVQLLVGDTANGYSLGRAGLFRAAATLPAQPFALVNALFALALVGGKADRSLAQEALRSHPGKEARIIEALADGKADTRAVAAQWLGRLRHAGAVPALEKAVAKEKHDVAKGAMLDALQLLGQPVEKYLDRKALAADAAKSLAKGMPKDIDWFPWEALPTVKWADTQAAVSREVLQWMLVQAVKQKTPEPNAVLRKYCGMFDASDREALGQFVLETWLHEDTRPITPEEAIANARDMAQSSLQFMNQYPQYNQNSPHLGKSEEELVAAYLPGCLKQPRGSAIGSKGLLAVAAACCAERAAPPVQRYLKEWYGMRPAQGKALIGMLAWVDHPSATQLMLAIGSRFRTKSFQEEATKQAEALADRKGWTLAELADRTIPTAGFDEDGRLELSYGPRMFTARLLPDFKVELLNPEGKKITALPEPRQDDDAERAKEAKKALGAARKELKSIVDLQTDRLYEALCTERDWPYADWVAYLQRHPVLRHLVQRLVWVETAGTAEALQVRQSFRPLDDGTLTDLDDNEVQLAADARVRLAHDSLLDAGQVAAWQQHLADYEIKPLFQQLGKGLYRLPADKAQADEVVDFEGHMLDTFALRGRALKLGYTRGPSEDGGWFYVYEKRFPTLGLQVVIEFTGNPLPEENRSVALRKLTFASTAGGSNRWERSKIALSKVPAVLLSECYNDLRLIAAEGSGFDPEWQRKSEL